MSNSSFYKGLVIQWAKGPGWGRLKYVDDDGETQIIFTHHSCIKGKRLWKGQYVHFRIGMNERGPIAVDVEPIPKGVTICRN